MNRVIVENVLGRAATEEEAPTILDWVLSFTLITICFFYAKLFNIILKWDNSNSIIHGALSITGLGILMTNRCRLTKLLICGS